MYDFALRSGGVDIGLVGQVVFQIEEMAVLLLIDHFFIGQGGQGLGIPVDHAHAAIDEPFVVEVAEDFDDALAAFLVHGEGRAVPVAGGTQPAQLLEDDAAMLVGPGPGVT